MADASREPNVDATPAARYGAQRLFRDAGWMTGATVGSAVFGAAFWALAARIYPPSQMGVATAIIAVINAVGSVVASVAGDPYTALFPAVGSGRLRIYRLGRRRQWLLSSVAGLVSGIAVISLLSEVRGSLAVGALVAVGAVVWTSSVVQYRTLIAVGQARLTPASNILTSFGRVLLLPVFIIAVGWHSVELAFITSAAIVVGIFIRPISRFISSPDSLSAEATISEEEAVSSFKRLSTQMVTNAALAWGPPLLAPFLVSAIAGPTQGAFFALCLTFAQLIDIVTAAMSWSLAVHASSQPEQSRSMARTVLIRMLAIAALGFVCLFLVVPVVLPFLNPQYGGMKIREVIVLLCAASIVRCFYQVWSDLQLSRRKMSQPVVVNIVSAITLFALMPLFASNYGAVGGAMAYFALRLIGAISAGVFLFFSSHTHQRGGRHHL
jgi:O-antigen/teichoic acid export membrane protein